MIVDLDLRGKRILVIGGGMQAQKRLGHLIGEGCSITLVSTDVTPQIDKWAESKSIEIKRQTVGDVKFISKLRPDLIITTTDDSKTNQKIINYAKKAKIMAYSSDNPEESDFANPAVIDLEGVVQVAVFTGGQSPSMSKKIRAKMEVAIKEIIRKEDIEQIRLQKVIRVMARNAIPDQYRRRKLLEEITNDRDVEQLIKDGQIKGAEKRAVAMLGNRE